MGRHSSHVLPAFKLTMLSSLSGKLLHSTVPFIHDQTITALYQILNKNCSRPLTNTKTHGWINKRTTNHITHSSWRTRPTFSSTWQILISLEHVPPPPENYLFYIKATKRYSTTYIPHTNGSIEWIRVPLCQPPKHQEMRRTDRCLITTIKRNKSSLYCIIISYLLRWNTIIPPTRKLARSSLYIKSCIEVRLLNIMT